MNFVDYITLWFEVDEEYVATACHYYDLERGYVQMKVQADERGYKWRNAGLYPIKSCVGVTKHRFVETMSTSAIMKWEDKDKLFEKYPMLKQLAA